MRDELLGWAASIALEDRAISNSSLLLVALAKSQYFCQMRTGEQSSTNIYNLRRELKDQTSRVWTANIFGDRRYIQHQAIVIDRTSEISSLAQLQSLEYLLQ